MDSDIKLPGHSMAEKSTVDVFVHLNPLFLGCNVPRKLHSDNITEFIRNGALVANSTPENFLKRHIIRKENAIKKVNCIKKECCYLLFYKKVQESWSVCLKTWYMNTTEI